MIKTSHLIKNATHIISLCMNAAFSAGRGFVGSGQGEGRGRNLDLYLFKFSSKVHSLMNLLLTVALCTGLLHKCINLLDAYQYVHHFVWWCNHHIYIHRLKTQTYSKYLWPIKTNTLCLWDFSLNISKS